MDILQKPAFAKLLSEVLASYGKSLPESAILAAWWSNLQPFPFRAVEAAFQTYKDQNGAFAPVPAGIAIICKTMDGRPSDEEAWAMSFPCISESETVVWTEEMCAAFNECRPLLEVFDNVGARMSFKDAYNRLVSQARSAGIPARWSASLGWDVRKRESALQKAHVAGLLAAPTVVALLPNHSDVATPQDSCPEGLKKVKEMMAQLKAQREIDSKREEQEREAERVALQNKKDDIKQIVENLIGAKK